jgi:D-alanine-D-alanine ligase
MSYAAITQRINTLVTNLSHIADDICMIMVANIKGAFDPKNGTPRAQAESEYFSDAELTQLMDGLASCGIATRFYNGELNFIDAYNSGQVTSIGSRHKLVYSTAQSGEGAGRKSLIPAFCRLVNQPYCNSDAYVLSLVRNKFHVHSILRAMQLSVPPSWVFLGNNKWLGNEKPPCGMTLIAKLLYESSSIGLDERSVGTMSRSYTDVLNEKSSLYNQPVVVQKFIPGYEIEVCMLDIDDGVALPPVSVRRDGAEMGDRILNFSLVAEDLYDLVYVKDMDARFGEASFRVTVSNP